MNFFTWPPSSKIRALRPGCWRSMSSSAARTVAPDTRTSSLPSVSLRSGAGMRIRGMTELLCSGPAGRAVREAREPHDARGELEAEVIEDIERAVAGGRVAGERERRGRRDAADRADRRAEHARVAAGRRLGGRRLEQAPVARGARRADHHRALVLDR